ncbi:MAG: type I pullulanase [Staphylococcus sp.]|nr:type I pullulanase [Staphylococcus sp.]
MFWAYLEDFYDVKIIISNDISINDKLIYAKTNKRIILLNIEYMELKDEYQHLYLKSSEELEPNIDTYIEIMDVGIEFLYLGKITRSSSFDKKYYFDGWLGFKYDKSQTIFRIWSPVIKEINIIVENDKYELSYLNNGLWETTINKNLDGCKYYYEFRINKDFERTLDPYAISSNANHEFNYIIDKDRTYKMKHNYYQKSNFSKTCICIYELNIRDATIKTSAINKGTYEALSNSLNQNYGLGYLKKMPITHLQLLPMFAFGGVDENIRDANEVNFKYNWGYNPMQYMVPSGFFSNNPNDPYQRINELKKMIDTIHSIGFGVNMDVVFNHVFDSNWFPLEKLVPGYTFRTDKLGFLTNSSWCGNDLCTNHLMVRKLIVDSIQYFQTFYMIDGFRFDLMGLIDIDTMKLIVNKTKAVNSETMIYGEGWNMDVVLSPNQRTNLNNANKVPLISFFNDYFRNKLRGIDANSGYLIGESLSKSEIFKLIKGYYYDNQKFAMVDQSINYVECHDNYTLYDLIRMKRPHYSFSQIIDYVKLSLGFVVLSAGIPFIHAGEELFRSKKFIDNSYNASDDINGIDWFTSLNVSETLRDLLILRRKIFALECCEVTDIDKYIKLDASFALPQIRFLSKNCEVYQMVISNNYETHTKFLAPGSVLIFDGTKIVEKTVQSYVINKPSIVIFKK